MREHRRISGRIFSSGIFGGRISKADAAICGGVLSFAVVLLGLVGFLLFAPATAEETAACGARRAAKAEVYAEEGTVFRQAPEASSKAAITCNVDWGEEEIPEILDILAERGVKITFFVSGKWAQNHPKLLRRMYVEGHEIGNHGYGHKMCSKLSPEQTVGEIQKTEQAVSELLGIKTTLFAPPAGDYDAQTVEICRQLGYKLTLWSADTIDWKEGSDADTITKRIVKKDLDGAIILMHPKPETVKALPAILDELKRRNIQPVPLYELGIY